MMIRDDIDIRKGTSQHQSVKRIDSAQTRVIGVTTTDPAASDYVFLEPTLEHGSVMHELVQATGVLEANSAYSYVMLAEHFAETCLIAERNGQPVGFVSAFISPDRQDTLFVWQIGVIAEEQGQGLGRQMLRALLARPVCSEVRYLEATVAESNTASAAMFRAFARDITARCRLARGFEEEHFPGDGHEAERLFRIGPFANCDLEQSLPKEATMETFSRHESAVRSYCRSFPTVFERARGYTLWDENGREYLDFFAGAGALNYGHNHPLLKEALVDYVSGDGVTHGLDMATAAKREFLQRFHDVILRPRHLDYRMMFPGPTGTNAVESALKLARKVTGRQTVIGFTNGFHGMTLGSLAVTGNAFKRNGAGVPLMFAATMPYDDYIDDGGDSIDYFEQMLADGGSGIDQPAAVIVETVQGEGGLRAASFEWLRRLEALCRRHDMLLIVDDIQAGCGRTGTFFSFEPAGISPDIVCLSKSISGYGLPMALVLIKPEYDQFAPGEHNGTFRGNNVAFVTATAALDFWKDGQLSTHVDKLSRRIDAVFEDLVRTRPKLAGEIRGRGLMRGLMTPVAGLAEEISAAAFRRGLIVETSGPDSEVIKLLPPLTIDEVGLERGLGLLREAVDEALAAREAADASADEASLQRTTTG